MQNYNKENASSQKPPNKKTQKSDFVPKRRKVVPKHRKTGRKRYYLCSRQDCTNNLEFNNLIVTIMAKKDEQELEMITEEQEVVETPNFKKWKAGIMKRNPNLTEESDMEDFYAASSAGYDSEHDYAKKQRAEVESLRETLTAHPELADFMDAAYNAKDGDLGAAILNLGEVTRAYANGEIDSPAYKAGMEEKKRKEAEVKEKSALQAVAFEDACKELGVDPEETAQALTEKLFNPMAAYELTKEVWGNLIKMLNYDDDVAAAEVKGRNANIMAKRKKLETSTDGIPHAPSATASTRATESSPLDDVVGRRMARRKL
jgi:hypothetical protein